MRQSISDDLSAFSYRNRGLAYAVLAEAFGTAMNAVVQLLEARYETPKAIHSLTILFLRMSLTAVFTSAGVWYRGVPDPFGPHGARLLLVLRSFAGLCGVLGMYWSLMYLDLGEATVISLLSPQMACLLSALWMKETINVSEQISLLISLGGVLLIIRPFGWDQTTETTSGEAHLRRSMAAEGAHGLVRLDLSLSLRLAGAMSALLGATGGAVAMLAIRQAGDRVHPLVSVNYYAWACTAVALMSIALSGDWTELLPEGTIAWVLIGSLSACGFLKFYLAKALTSENSNRAIYMAYTQMIFALILEAVLSGELPRVESILGGTIILGSVIFVATRTGNRDSDAERQESGEELLESHGGAAQES